MQAFNQQPLQLKRFGARGVRQRNRPQYFQSHLAALPPDTLDVIGDLAFDVDHEESRGNERVPAGINSCAGFRKVPDGTVESGMGFWERISVRTAERADGAPCEVQRAALYRTNHSHKYSTNA